MNKRLKQIIKIFILILISSLGSCTNEETEKQELKSQTIFKSVSLNDLKLNNTDNNLIETVKKIKEIQNSSTNRSVYNAQYDFYIDQEKGYLIQEGASKNYTFPIYRMNSNDNDIENVVFTLNQQGDYDIATTKYDVTKEELESPTFDDQVFPKDINILSGKLTEHSCFYILMCCNNGSGGGNGVPHIAGVNCTNTNHLYYVPVGNTNSNSGSSGTPIVTPTGNSSNTAGGATSGNQNNGSATSGPVTTLIGGSLSSKQIGFIRGLVTPETFMGLANNVSNTILNYITSCNGPQIYDVQQFCNAMDSTN